MDDAAHQIALQIISKAGWNLIPILADRLEEIDEADKANDLRKHGSLGITNGAVAVGAILLDLVPEIQLFRWVEDLRNPRRSVRQLDLQACERKCLSEAIIHGKSCKCWHGGGVSKSYRHFAETDGVLAAALFDRETMKVRLRLQAMRVRANSVTLRHVATRFGYPSLFDTRTGETRKQIDREIIFADVAEIATHHQTPPVKD